MSIHSMTGFARVDGALGAASWHWEVRSVNNRGLDLRIRLAPGYEALEPRVREGIGKRVTRGSVTVALSVARVAVPVAVRLNTTALEQVIRVAETLRERLGAEPPRVEGLLALKGVLEVAEETDDPTTAGRMAEAMTDSLMLALDRIVVARQDEGRRLSALIGAQIEEISRLSAAIEVSPGRTPAAIEARLRDQVSRLLEAGNALDPARLHQEAVLMATRADVEEELKRLAGHVEAARALLRDGGAIGRKLDFLAQEFNREANTLTSKAGDAEIARLGLALKVVVDQMREQVQNIE